MPSHYRQRSIGRSARRHRLTLADLNQAERYLVLAEAHTGGVSWTAALVGQAKNDDVRRTAKLIRTFTDLLADARHRFEEHLRILEPARSEAAVVGFASSRATQRNLVTHSGESVTVR